MHIGERAGLRQAGQMRDAFGNALLEIVSQNSNVIVLDGDLAESTRAIQVRKEFPERFFNLGIAESNIVSVAVGLATCGLIPVVTGFSSFLLCNAFDQIRIGVSLSRSNVKIIGSHGGISASLDGPTPMSIEDLALAGALPNIAIIVPSDPVSMSNALQAIVDYDGPVFLRSSRHDTVHIYGPQRPIDFRIGSAYRLREGEDTTLMACGIMTALALDAAAILSAEGIEARVVDLLSIRPLDRQEVIAAARETGSIVTVEEHILSGGVGSNIARVVAEEYPVPMGFIGLQDKYTESGQPLDLFTEYGMTSADIVHTVRRILRRRSR